MAYTFAKRVVGLDFRGIDFNLFTYATWNPADTGADVTLSNGNLSYACVVSTNFSGTRSTIGKSSGKWYWEITLNSDGQGLTQHAVKQPATDRNDASANNNEVAYVGIIGNSKKIINFSQIAYGTPLTSGNVVGVALDMDAGEVTYYRNGISQGVAITGLTGIHHAGLSLFTSTGGETSTANFGATPFAYTPPVGFNAGLYV